MAESASDKDGRRVPPNSIRSTSSKSQPLRPGPVRFYIPLNVVLVLLVISHTLSALYAPILDCDETYNYWEPLHYLTHGYGMQTWEYSPEYALRSWAYIGIDALPVKIISFFITSKATQFYTHRTLLGFISAACETKLYSTISRTLNPRIGVFYFLITLTSSGIFHASTSFLPSSFAMYTSTLALSAFLTPSGPHGPLSAQGIMYFGIGALLGWPFAAALIIPFVVEEVLTAIIMSDVLPFLSRYLDGIVRCLVILGLQTSIDSFFYRRFSIVPIQLVLYNIFSDTSRGPNIFGTEPWHFYIRNLTLNFNLWFLLAMLSLPLLLISSTISSRPTTKQTLLRTTTFLSPFYLWLIIFTIQPHKEERFMYPSYPFLALNASIALHLLLSHLGQSQPGTILSRIPPSLKLALILPIITTSLLLSILRSIGTITAYSAPLTLYSHLVNPNPNPNPNLSTTISTADVNICLGKEWYRFPTSFFLPTPLQARFVRSEFDGLLPGSFSEAEGPGFFPGAHLIPSGMNDVNEFSPDKVIDIEHCEYLVDSEFPSTVATELEPNYVGDAEEGKGKWEVVKCERLLDASATHLLARTLWMPDLKIVPEKFRRKWGRYCLLKRRTT